MYFQYIRFHGYIVREPHKIRIREKHYQNLFRIMDSMIPPLFPENQSDLSGDTIESCHHAYISDVQVGVFSGRVKSSLSEDS